LLPLPPPDGLPVVLGPLGGLGVGLGVFAIFYLFDGAGLVNDIKIAP